MTRISPNVSVILPSYNRVHTLPAAIASVLNQTYSDLELIVVDDGSTDSTQAYLNTIRDPRLVCVKLDKNSGVAAARNAGLMASSGVWVAFQDSDDEWLLGKLESQIAYLKNCCDDGVGGVVCGIVRHADGNIINNFSKLCADKSVLGHSDVLTTYCIYTQTWLMPRQLLTDLGGFDEAMGIWDDWEMLMRISQHITIGLMHEYLVVSGRSEDSLSAVNPKWIPDLEHILDRHAEHLTAFPKQHARLHHLLGRQCAQQGAGLKALSELSIALRIDPWVLRRWALLLLALIPPLARALLQPKTVNN